VFDRFSHWVLNTKPTQTIQVRRFVWALNENGGPFNIRIGANVEPDRPIAQPEAQAQAQAQNAEPGVDAAAAAEHTIRVSGASIGRLIGGALIIPAVSNRMGALLFHLSSRSPLLRHILAIRPPLSRPPPMTPPLLWRYSWMAHDAKALKEQNTLMRIAIGLKFAFGAMWSGTRLWAECDPVW
jgi:hypothetical protein